MIGKIILHYKIKEKLGEGGMGVVYLAEDNRLKRDVAIKFLPGFIAGNSDERKRFEIEAQAAAALNHAHISHIYAIEETENQIFIVMEYIKGKELKEIVNAHKANGLPVKQVIDYACQIAEGIEAAHEKNIVHRDIKSTNIMITDKGKAKIMDFGLAKFRGSAQLTQIGTTIGTAAYMSPEQARGEEVDLRSDIWSFGVILYEMLTAKMPFKGEYEAAILFSIINDEAEVLTDLNPDAPAQLFQIINKCLEKNKEKRYQSAEQISEDLTALKTENSQSTVIRSTSPLTINEQSVNRKTALPKWILPAVALLLIVAAIFYFIPSVEVETQTAKKMLVVLPFQNMGSADQEYFADGITGEITSRLSGISGLGVIARTSAMHYKKTDKSLKQIADELGIDYVLIGTIQWQQLADNKKRVRVNSELIQVKNSTQIWSKPYDADFADAFQLQSDIAGQVAAALNIKLLQNEKKALDEKLSDNAEAYDYYLRGFDYFSRSYQKEDWLIAERMFKKAIELDPNFAAAYSRLANLQVSKYWFYFDRTEQNLADAKFNIEKAKELNPDNYIITESTGWYHYHAELDYEPALREFNISLRQQPNNASVYVGIASVLRRQGKMEQAVEFFEKAVDLDPRSSLNMDQLGETLYLLRKYDEAEGYFDRAIAMAPDQIEFSDWKALISIVRDGNSGKAREIVQNTKGQASVGSLLPLNLLYMIELIDGNYDKALELCDKIEDDDNQFVFYPRVLMKAFVYRLMGNDPQARRYFTEALDIVKQKLKENSNDPRFHSSLGLIYAGLGKKEEAVKAGIYATELMPISMEAWRGAWRILNLAEIYTMVGEKKKALTLLDQLLAMPMDISINLIDLHPSWDPLKSEPEYNALLVKYNLKNND